MTNEVEIQLIKDQDRDIECCSELSVLFKSESTRSNTFGLYSEESPKPYWTQPISWNQDQENGSYYYKCTVILPSNIGSYYLKSLIHEWVWSEMATGCKKIVVNKFPIFSCKHTVKGENIILEVQSNSSHIPSTAWIGLYLVNNDDRKYEAFKWYHTSQKVFPLLQGNWEFRIFLHDYSRCYVYPEINADPSRENGDSILLLPELSPYINDTELKEYMIQINPDNVVNTLKQLNELGIQTIRIATEPVYKIEVTPQQLILIEKMYGVEEIIPNDDISSIPTNSDDDSNSNF